MGIQTKPYTLSEHSDPLEETKAWLFGWINNTHVTLNKSYTRHCLNNTSTATASTIINTFTQSNTQSIYFYITLLKTLNVTFIQILCKFGHIKLAQSKSKLSKPPLTELTIRLFMPLKYSL